MMRRTAIAFSIVGLAFATSCSLIHTLEPIDDGGCTGAQCDGGQHDADTCTDSCDMSKACTTAQTCSATTPVCSSTGSCTACTPGGAGTSTECATYHSPTKLCGPSGACVECLTKDDCASTNRTCDTTTYACATCKAHADCSTGVCKAGGVCASASEVAYVNRDLAGCAETPHTSTAAAPYCQIQTAATLDSAPYIVVAGSATSYNALNLTAIAKDIGPLTIVGPGRKPVGGGLTAKIAPAAASPAVVVITNGSAATVTLDGLELTSGTASPGVKCSQNTGAASLTLIGSYVHGSAQSGVDSSGCKLVLDANVITGNPGGGVHYAGGSTTYTITNNIIHDNSGSGAYGARIDDSPTGSVFAFNTVVANGPTGNTAAGGAICPATGTTALLQDSIIANNGLSTAGGTQFAGQCQLQTVVVGVDSTVSGGAVKKAPALTSDDYLDVSTPSAQTTNADCCINKLAAPGTPNADHDVDRGTRPKGAGTTPYDIGGHEAQ
jgi:parallel beta helix pectate lyase-like protein